MSGLLIDTSAYIEFARGRRGAWSEIKSFGVFNCFVPHIAVAELLVGAYKAGSSAGRINKLERGLSVFRILFSSFETCHLFGRLKADLESEGRPIPVNDIWIAAIALEHDLTLLAKDKHFQRISDLSLFLFSCYLAACDKVDWGLSKSL